MDNKLTISISEAARRLGISKTTAYQLARQDNFPAFTVGERWLVSAAGLEKWVEDQAKGGEIQR